MLPFVPVLLNSWIACGFEAKASRRALERVLRDPTSGASESLLNRDALSDGGLVARQDLLHPVADRSLRIQVFEDGRLAQSLNSRFTESTAAEVGRILRAATGTVAAREQAGLPQRVTAALAPAVESQRRFPRITEPGIYRREHSSIVIRSETTSVMLDPVMHWMPGGVREPTHVDAVFITHGHADHFNVASILAVTRDVNTPVIVPPVPKTSMLAASDMRAALALVGQRSLAPAWGTSLSVGDVYVDVLPYYGEQPVRDGEGPPPEVRNWGSCYRFTTPQFTALTLIDSGADPSGDMVEVVRQSSLAHGPVDFMLSSLARFASPFFLGLPHYYLALPFDRLRALFEQFVVGVLPCVTLGPEGVLDACRAARPRYYLPYGNGFEGVGVPIQDVGMHTGEPPEGLLVQRLNEAFEREQLPTRSIAWNPGDHMALRAGRAVRVSAL